MKRWLVLAAGLLVLAANGWVLVSAHRNRAAAPGGTVTLTEREVRLVRVSDDSTAVMLGLLWAVDSAEVDDEDQPAWLNAARLEELGFDCRVPATSAHASAHYRAMAPALRYAVLEYDGEAARKSGRRWATRLVVVDVGRDPLTLRAKHSDPARHIICQALVRPVLREWSRRERRRLEVPRLTAMIESILPQLIYVPPPHNRALLALCGGSGAKAQPDPAEASPRYQVTLSWGARYEPWVRAVGPWTAPASQ